MPAQSDLHAVLALQDVGQAYGAHAVLQGLAFSLDRGSIACLLGPSGCGKTTVLRCIAGFEPIQSGEIRLNEIPVSRPGMTLPPEFRRIGMVFQDYALFPHLTVAQNIAFGLHAVDRTERDRRVGRYIDATGLAGLEHQFPHELSGGQQQRVALARAMAPRPELLLLDEPFSNLDVDLRERLVADVRSIIKRFNITAILVTHDQYEAFAIADEVGVMHEGRIEQWDSAYNLYHRPATRFVADFVGQGVFVPGTVLNAEQVEIELGTLNGVSPRLGGNGGFAGGESVEVLLRPDDIIHDDASGLQAEVQGKAFRGADILYTLKLNSGRKVFALVPSHHDHAIGERIGIRLDVDHVVAFPVIDEAK
jgi:iron(III) transport system ATP-binding protein